VEQTSARGPGAGAVQVIDIDESVVTHLSESQRRRTFAETFGYPHEARTDLIKAGDSVTVTIWEAPPATLFGLGIAPQAGVAMAQPAPLPEQLVDKDGGITVPFAGRISVVGTTPRQVEAEIARRLAGKANHPEVVVQVRRGAGASVTVVGDVATSVRMPLTPSGERVLDAIAAAGGVRQSVNKMMVEVTRGPVFEEMPLDQLIREPQQNVKLEPGDIVTALFQPYSFTALGATGRNEEVSFEAQGINLAQAIARAGGVLDNRAHPQGVFVFRFEPSTALQWPREPEAKTADGKVPVVYRVDLRDPKSFFVMQGFQMKNKDVLYVSNAPASELQKFLNLVFSLTYPITNLVRTFD
jgi:polysaccharide export outer membrane protein